jgi:threonine/homoserine/homoserine lactone efflux protein
MTEYVTMPRSNSHTTLLTLGERTLYVGGGVALAAASVRPRPHLLLTILGLAAGAYLAWRGVEGTDPVKAMITQTTREPMRAI